MKYMMLLAALLMVTPAFAASSGPQYPRAQKIADQTVASHSGMLDVIMHVSPTEDAPNVVVAAHLTKAVGEASGEDDLGVAKTGAPLIEVQRDGVRLGILLQMRDARRHAIGAIGMMYTYKAGDDIESRILESISIRNDIAKEIPSKAALLTPD